ncbi:MAG: Maf family protein [Eggerthellaceae bacterium]|nr:Maf family protein [Eggerthellaceae bacterium]
MENNERIKIILASASPRRKQLLEAAGLEFEIRVADIDETLDAEMAKEPSKAALVLAEKKAGAVVSELLESNPLETTLVIAADTMVVFNNEIFGKPRSFSDAKGMLRKLSGNTHKVVTAVSVWMIAVPKPGKVTVGRKSFVESSLVTFVPLSDEAIDAYLRAGESFDKAGAYAAQGEGAKLIKAVEGDLDTVIGLPVRKLLEEFPELMRL